MIVSATAARVDAPAIPGFNREDASNFLWNVMPDLEASGLSLSLWNGRTKLSHHATDIEEALDVAERWVANGDDVYYGTCPRRPGLPPEKRGGVDDVACVPMLWAEIDFADPAAHKGNRRLPATDADVRRILSALGLEPTGIVPSGHGLHLYWLLTEPLYDIDAAKPLSKRFGDHFASVANSVGFDVDPISDLPRLLRVPGTVNFKAEPKPVQIQSYTDRRYTVAEIEALLPAPVVRERPKLRLVQDVSVGRAEIYGATALKNECEAVASASNGERNNQLNRSAFSLGQLVGGGVLDRDVVESSLTAAAESVGLRSFEIARTIRSGIEDGVKNPRSIPDEPATIRRQRQVEPEAASADAPDVLESRAPMDTARHLLAAKFTHTSGLPTIRRSLGAWWTHNGSRYVEASDEEVQATTYLHFDGVKVRTVTKKDEERIVPFGPNRNSVGESLSALKSLTLATGEMPQWLDGRTSPAPRDVVAFENGLLDVGAFCRGDVSLMPPTPAWFSGAACPYDFNPDAKCEAWLNFLGDVFDADCQSMDLLQEWFGLQLVPNMSYEKLMLMVGPPRAGKGTVLSVMEAMLGRDQLAVTSFSNLAENFGKAPLLGKLAAIMPDAHLGRSTDDRRALESLKSIVGGDPQTVNRKNVDELPSVRLMTRFTIAVNELPKLPDDAGSLQPRLLVLHFARSFAGREDTGLKARLMAEAPGVALWALEGLKRLRERGVFTKSDRSTEIINEFSRLVAPVQGFVEDRCIVSPDAWASKDDVYRSYCEWCEAEGNQPESKVVFGRHLFGAAPSVTSGKRGPRGSQFTAYDGLKLL